MKLTIPIILFASIVVAMGCKEKIVGRKSREFTCPIITPTIVYKLDQPRYMGDTIILRTSGFAKFDPTGNCIIADTTYKYLRTDFNGNLVEE